MARKKIVIVDSTFSQEIIRELRGLNTMIYVAENLSRAVSVINMQKPDIVSLDNYLPNDEEDSQSRPYGGDLAKACKQSWGEIKVLGFSSSPELFENAEYFDVILDKKTQKDDYRPTIERFLRNGSAD